MRPRPALTSLPASRRNDVGVVARAAGPCPGMGYLSGHFHRAGLAAAPSGADCSSAGQWFSAVRMRFRLRDLSAASAMAVRSLCLWTARASKGYDRRWAPPGIVLQLSGNLVVPHRTHSMYASPPSGRFSLYLWTRSRQRQSRATDRIVLQVPVGADRNWLSANTGRRDAAHLTVRRNDGRFDDLGLALLDVGTIRGHACGHERLDRRSR
jgi:hypothetical protein